MEDLNEQQCLDCIAKHPDKIIGVKIRLVAQLANNGKHEDEAYRYTVCLQAETIRRPCNESLQHI